MGVYYKETKNTFKLRSDGRDGRGLIMEDGRCLEYDNTKMALFCIMNLNGSHLSFYFNQTSGNLLNMVSIYSLGIRVLDHL